MFSKLYNNFMPLKVHYKIGFWSLFSIVVGSQLGSGFFVIPSVIAEYGLLSLVGWGISGIGAISLALVLCKLSSWTAKTGGPHTFVNEAFGRDFAFFTGWTYWVISWASTSVIVVASVGYLTPLFGGGNEYIYLALEIVLLFGITFLNCQGLQTAGVWEFVLSLFQIIPLLAIPISAIFISNDNVTELSSIRNLLDELKFGDIKSLILITFWCFIGMESATTTAGSVSSPKKVVPRSTIIGTLTVLAIYILNTFCIVRLVPTEFLSDLETPYVDVVKVIFGEDIHLILSLISFTICVGAINAWTLVSGQISLGLAEDKFLPNLFAKKNRNEAPFVGLMTSFVGIAIILILTSHTSIAKQISNIIDLSVNAFIFVYLMCIIAFFKLLWRKGNHKIRYWVYGIISSSFCLWILYQHPLLTIASTIYIISGIPVYFVKIRKKKHL